MKVGILIFFMAKLTFGQYSVSNNADFLGYNASSDVIVYFKFSSSSSDEYEEGFIYLFDVSKKSHTKLETDELFRGFVTVHWPNDSMGFFLATGERIYRYSFADDKLDTIYNTDSGEIIRAITFAENPWRMAITTFFSQKESDLEKVIVLSDKFDIYGGVEFRANGNPSEYSIQYVTIIPGRPEWIAIQNSKREIWCIDIFRNSNRFKIDDNVDVLYKAFDSSLYFVCRESSYCSLYVFNIEQKMKRELLSAKSLSIDYLNRTSEGLVLAFDDNIFIYSEAGTFDNVSPDNKGKFVFYDGELAIQKRGNDLYYYKLK
jgi:hypothetical protein